jgi:hypothetical protein
VASEMKIDVGGVIIGEGYCAVCNMIVVTIRLMGKVVLGDHGGFTARSLSKRCEGSRAPPSELPSNPISPNG